MLEEEKPFYRDFDIELLTEAFDVESLLGVIAELKGLFLFSALKYILGFSELKFLLLPDDFSAFFIVFFSYEVSPSTSSSLESLQSPSISNLLIKETISYLEATCPIFLKNLLRFFSYK